MDDDQGRGRVARLTNGSPPTRLHPKLIGRFLCTRVLCVYAYTYETFVIVFVFVFVFIFIFIFIFVFVFVERVKGKVCP